MITDNPIRSIDTINGEFDDPIGKITTQYKPFDPDKITHIYHLGHKKAYGRSNNQIVTILHAIDMALDEHGDLPNNRAVVAVSNWAFQILQEVFYNGTDRIEFSIQLEQLRPVLLVHEDRLETLGIHSRNVTHIYLRTVDAYYHLHRTLHKHTPQQIKKRRQVILGNLIQYGFAERNLLLYKHVIDYIKRKGRDYGNGKNQITKYITIHSRWMEGECENRLGHLIPKDECWMTPSYIKNIMGGTVDRPIVLISDGQNQEVIQNLKDDADIGPALIIPGDIAPEGIDFPQPWSDMMIAVMGDAFVGTRISSSAAMIGLIRVLKGADPGSNFVYTSRSNSRPNEETNIEICKHCLFLCKGNRYCGQSAVHI